MASNLTCLRQSFLRKYAKSRLTKLDNEWLGFMLRLHMRTHGRRQEFLGGIQKVLHRIKEKWRVQLANRFVDFSADIAV